MKCPYCGSKPKLVDSKIIYKKRSYGPVWVCSRYPECDSYVGCHKGTNVPLGHLANKALREARMKAHAAFDPLWRFEGMKRKDAYRWLARELGRTIHIGSADIPTCEKVVIACHKRRYGSVSQHRIGEDFRLPDLANVRPPEEWTEW